MTNTVVRMCTTDRKPGELSSVFNENYGQDLLTIANPLANSINGSMRIQDCLADLAFDSLLLLHIFAVSELFQKVCRRPFAINGKDKIVW